MGAKADMRLYAKVTGDTLSQFKVTAREAGRQESDEFLFDPSPESDLLVRDWPIETKSAFLTLTWADSSVIKSHLYDEYETSIEPRLRLLRLEQLVTDHGLKVDDIVYEQIPRLMRAHAAAAARQSTYQIYAVSLTMISLIVGIPFLTGLLERIALGFSWATSTAVYLSVACFVLIAGFAVLAEIIDDSTIARQIAAIIMMLPAFVFLIALVTLPQNISRPSLGYRVLIGLAPSLLLIAALSVASMKATVHVLSRFRWHQAPVHEYVSFALITCAMKVLDEQQSESYRAIESCARSIEGELLQLAPRGDRTLWRWATDLSRRTGETIRQHKCSLATPSVGTSAVAQSLANGAAFAARGNFQAIALHDPVPAFPSIVRRWAPRMIIAGLLTTLAVSAPFLLPSLNVSGQLLSLRVGLVVSAVFALISPDAVDFRKRIADLVGEAAKNAKK